MKDNPKLKEALNYVMLVIGSLMLGISVGSILLPVKIATGGFSRNSNYNVLFVQYSS